MSAPGKPHRHRSLVFLLDEGSVTPLAHDDYVHLAQGRKVLPQLAGRRVRLADWYVEAQEGGRMRRVSEWYGWVSFDQEGRLDPSPGPTAAAMADNVDPTALPTPDEIERIGRCVAGAQGPQEGHA